MKIHPYLMFEGDCAEAFRFYERTLGGKLEMFTFRDSPGSEHVGPEHQDGIMHAHLDADGAVLMGSDNPTGNRESFGSFFVSLQTSDESEADRIFTALSEGGTVIMPLEKTFWAKRFGMLRDRFGVPWQVNCD